MHGKLEPKSSSARQNVQFPRETALSMRFVLAIIIVKPC